MWYQHEHVVHGAAQLSIAGPQDRQATNSIKDFFFLLCFGMQQLRRGDGIHGQVGGERQKAIQFLLPAGLRSHANWSFLTHTCFKQTNAAEWDG